LSTAQLKASDGSSDVKDLKLAELGRRRVAWAAESMPVLAAIAKHF
jgi:S-adenosylhomocysteine hydrolase